MHKLGYCLFEEVLHIFNPAIASWVVGVAVDSFLYLNYQKQILVVCF